MVRAFAPRPVPPELVDRLLDLATRAPSAGNTRPWAFVVLEGDETRRLWDVTLPDERRARFRWRSLLDAPVLVVPLVEPAAYVRRYAEPDKQGTGPGGGGARRGVLRPVCARAGRPRGARRARRWAGAGGRRARLAGARRAGPVGRPAPAAPRRGGRQGPLAARRDPASLTRREIPSAAWSCSRRSIWRRRPTSGWCCGAGPRV